MSVFELQLSRLMRLNAQGLRFHLRVLQQIHPTDQLPLILGTLVIMERLHSKTRHIHIVPEVHTL